MATRYALLVSLASLAAARTDLSGCVSSNTVAFGGASVLWYVPGTGEICTFLDCGGGAGAPITTQPGCADYSGTATVTPSYLPGYGPGAATMASATGSTSSSSSSSSAMAASSSMSSSSSIKPDPSSLETITTAPTPNASINPGGLLIPVNGTVPAVNGTSGGSSGSSNGSSSISGSGGSGSGSGPSSSSGSESGSGSSGSTPSPITSNSGAKQTAQVFLGSGALLGLGALVAAL